MAKQKKGGGGIDVEIVGLTPELQKMASSNDEQSTPSIVPEANELNNQPKRKVGKKMFGVNKIRDPSPEIPTAGISTSQFHS